MIQAFVRLCKSLHPFGWKWSSKKTSASLGRTWDTRTHVNSRHINSRQFACTMSSTCIALLAFDLTCCLRCSESSPSMRLVSQPFALKICRTLTDFQATSLSTAQPAASACMLCAWSCFFVLVPVVFDDFSLAIEDRLSTFFYKESLLPSGVSESVMLAFSARGRHSLQLSYSPPSYSYSCTLRRF